MKSTQTHRLSLQIAAFSLIRTIFNTGFRMIYPFLPVLARAVGVNLETMALIVTARSTLGLAGPVLGSLGDHIGRKRAMLIGLVLFVWGLFLVIFWPTFISLMLGFILGAAGKIIFDPAMQAYLGDRVLYAKRSRAIALTELGWSWAALFGLPLVGWIIARAGWIAPFPLLASLGGIAIFILWKILPSDPITTRANAGFKQALRAILAHPAALAGLGVGLLISFSNETVNIVYGAWIEQDFGLKVEALGAASAVIGLAELSGEGFVAALTDRIGKRWAIGSGIALIIMACLSLPFLGHTLPGALIGLFFIFIVFEFTFVSAISLMTELVPDARATMMAGNLTAAALGRALGALIGPTLFTIGLLANSTAAAGLAALALVILIRFVRVE
jgi:predicted MFS family arabinose efflux permease